jgi:hypothetical protein
MSSAARRRLLDPEQPLPLVVEKDGEARRLVTPHLRSACFGVSVSSDALFELPRRVMSREQPLGAGVGAAPSIGPWTCR